jgi:hypothetical protein
MQQANHLRGGRARDVQNHRRTRLGPLQLFEQAGRRRVVGQRKAYQYDIEILAAKKIEALSGAGYGNGGREQNSGDRLSVLFCNAEDSRGKTRCGSGGVENVETSDVFRSVRGRAGTMGKSVYSVGDGVVWCGGFLTGTLH